MAKKARSIAGFRQLVKDLYDEHHSPELASEAQASLETIAASLSVIREDDETDRVWHDRIESAVRTRIIKEEMLLEDIQLHREILGTRFVSARELLDRAVAVEMLAARHRDLKKRRMSAS